MPIPFSHSMRIWGTAGCWEAPRRGGSDQDRSQSRAKEKPPEEAFRVRLSFSCQPPRKEASARAQGSG